MKELKSKITHIRRHQHLGEREQQRMLPGKSVDICKVASHPKAACNNQLTITTAIPPLQPQLEPEQPPSQQIAWQRLTAQAEKINQLASELEAAMFELKAIASVIKHKQRIKHKTPKPLNHTCEFLATSVPDVKRGHAGGFILATRPVDLFQAEREATQTAQKLRRQVKRKRVLSAISSSKRYLLGWLL